MEYDNTIAVEWNNKRINKLIETTENNQRRINELTEKINKQDEVNKHINNKFRKVWDCINADHLRLEAVEEVITGINDKIDKLEAQERATTSIIEDNSCDIQTLQDTIINNEADASQDVIDAVLNNFLNDIKALLNNNTQTIKSDNKTRFVNVHNVELIVERYINNNTNSQKGKV